jgi:hypothetical protein
MDVKAWTPSRVVSYLCESLALDLRGKLPGQSFESHEELLGRLEQFGQPVHLYHLDAHADLGIGQDCYRFYAEFLAMSVPERRLKFREFKPRQGDFLLYAISCGFVEELDYVTHPEVFKREPDIPIGMDRWRHKYDDGQLDLYRFSGTESEYCLRQGKQTLDCSIPIRIYNRDTFKYRGKAFDYMFVTRSPEFTPVWADRAFRAVQDLIAS